MHIGGQHRTHTELKNFSDEEIAAMNLQPIEFWRVNKAFLLSICDYESSFCGS
jgi:hypothetical protein